MTIVLLYHCFCFCRNFYAFIFITLLLLELTKEIGKELGLLLQLKKNVLVFIHLSLDQFFNFLSLVGLSVCNRNVLYCQYVNASCATFNFSVNDLFLKNVFWSFLEYIVDFSL